MKRRALVTGVTGQDGSYLCELLLEQDYEVYGLIRRTSTTGTWRIDPFIDRLKLIPGDVTDLSSLVRAVKLVDPQEVYHFASQSSVAHSFSVPLSTLDITGGGTVRLLDALRQYAPHARFYHASSSEQFGNAQISPQTEETPFLPISPYGCAKVYAHTMAVTYRQAYKMFVCSGIAYNHESPRRGEEFVTRKITKAVAKIKVGVQSELRLGDTSARRDWSHAKDIVRGAWMMLQRDTPDDYVLASGETHSVQELVELAFNYASLNHHQYVKIDPGLFRMTEIQQLQGLALKATQLLGWRPTVTFSQLVQEMVKADLDAVEHHRTLEVR